MKIVSIGDNLHECQFMFFGENITDLSSAELAKRVVKVNVSTLDIGTPKTLPDFS